MKSVKNLDYTLSKQTAKHHIENMIVEWSMVDPTNLSANYQVCDGSVWKTNTYAKTFWEAEGVLRIPNLLGQVPRASASGSTNDPDRADRRQAVTGTVDITSGTVITLPKYYINLLKNAIDNARTIIIGQTLTTIFDTLAVFGTIQSVNTTLNTVTLTTITGTFTAGVGRSLIIKGDVVGSFQNDAMQKITGTIGNGSAGFNWLSGALQPAGATSYLSQVVGSAGNYANFDSSFSTDARTSTETRPKNIALLPVMMVDIPKEFTGFTVPTISVATQAEVIAGIDDDKIVTPLILKQVTGQFVGSSLITLDAYKTISPEFPYLCMSLSDRTLSTPNYSTEFINERRNRKIVYDELNTAVSSFTGTWSGSNFTLDNNAANIAMIAELYEDWLFAGSPVTGWRILVANGLEYNITGFTVASRIITVSGSPTGTSIEIYLNRILGSTTSCKHFSWAGLGLYMTGQNKITGLRRRDKFQLHQHETTITRSTYGIYGTSVTQALLAADPGSYSGPTHLTNNPYNGRTGTKTEIESATAMMYLYVGNYVS